MNWFVCGWVVVYTYDNVPSGLHVLQLCGGVHSQLCVNY